jgi:hypothetical protein
MQKREYLISKITQAKRAGGVAQVVKLETLRSNCK